MSNVKEELETMSNVRCQMSDVRCQMSNESETCEAKQARMGNPCTERSRSVKPETRTLRNHSISLNFKFQL